MRVLIATVTAGGGHLQAAAALDESWRRLCPSDVVNRVDLLSLVPRLQREVYARSYVKVVEHAPELWGMVFRTTDDPAWTRRVTRFRRMFARATNAGFVRHLRRFQPDIVLCTHYLPLEILGHLMAASQLHPYTVSIVTDFEAHALWMEQAVDLYAVAAEETRHRLVARGIPADQVLVTGIPIGANFRQPVFPAEIRKRMGLRDDLAILLVLSGGFGMGPVEEILSSLNSLATPVQVVVVAGRNDELRASLALGEYRHPTRVLGYVNHMHELMSVADLILTKPGGLTTSEALALGKPICIIRPIPGQEAANSDFLLEHGAAIKVNQVDDLPARLASVLGTERLTQLAEAARRLGKPGASDAICEEVARRCLERTRPELRS